ncbi:MAG: carbon-nitrogen hydrolase family protein [Planctomycetaceae bacterium]
MKLAGVQMDIAIGKPDENSLRMAEQFVVARQQGADLVIFPECAITGYCFESRDEASPFAESVTGESVAYFTNLCRERGGMAVFGMIERDGERLYNAAALVGPQGLIASYRKVHLPYLGVDRFLDLGDRPFAVYETEGVRLGLNICYDSGFPESSRVLALAGADLVVLPTNWPTGAETLAEHAIATRALENAIYYAAVNRVGEERGFRFIGRSRICDPAGRTLAVGSTDGEEILFAEIDPARSRNKTIVRVPGQHLIDRMADRRPEFYRPLVDPHGLPRPGRDVSAEWLT